MGMFDYIKCEYPLPGNVALDVQSFAYRNAEKKKFKDWQQEEMRKRESVA